MNAIEKSALRDLLLLSLTAGSADAAGYMGLGRVFTSNMTGNVVLFGIALGQGEPWAALRSVFVLAVFLVGASLGAWIGHKLTDKGWAFLATRIISLEALLLVIFALIWFVWTGTGDRLVEWQLIALLAVAMGLQSAAMNLLSAPGVGTTAITGTFISLISGLVGRWSVSAPDAKPSRSRIGFQATVIALYAAGATLSGLLILHVPQFVGFPAALFVLFVALDRWRDARAQAV